MRRQWYIQSVIYLAVTFLSSIGLSSSDVALANDGKCQDLQKVDWERKVASLSPGERIRVVEALSVNQEGSMKCLAFLLKDPDLAVREKVVESLTRFGAKAADVLPDLISSLQTDESVSVQEKSAQAIGSMGANAKDAVPALFEIIMMPGLSVRREAFIAIHQIGEAAVPFLTSKLKDSDEAVRHQAILELQQLGEASKGAMPALIDVVMHGEDRELRGTAVHILSTLDDPQTIPTLLHAALTIQGFDSSDQDSAREGLVRLGRKAVPALLPIVRSKTYDRFIAMSTLREIGPEAQESLGDLIEVFADNRVSDNDEARATILAIGPQAIPSLAKALEDPRNVVRREAVKTLGAFGPMAEASVTVLREVARKDRSAGVRVAAKEAVFRITRGKPSAVRK